MTEKDKKNIAELLAKELKNHKPVIRRPNGIDTETAQLMKELVGIMKTGKKAWKPLTDQLLSSFTNYYHKYKPNHNSRNSRRTNTAIHADRT